MRGIHGNPAGFKAEFLKFRGEQIADLAHTFKGQRSAIDIHGLFEEGQGIFAVFIDIGGDIGFGGAKGFCGIGGGRVLK